MGDNGAAPRAAAATTTAEEEYEFSELYDEGEKPLMTSPRNSIASPRGAFVNGDSSRSLSRRRSVTFEGEEGTVAAPPAVVNETEKQDFSSSKQTALLRRQSSVDLSKSSGGGDVGDEFSELKISPCDFELLTVIGKGAYGRVLQVRETRTGTIFAMKVLQKGQVLQKNNLQYVQEERNILSKADHPFVVHLFCAFQTHSKLYLVMEYVQGGELFSHLRNEGLFDEDQTRFYAGEVILAIEYLHQHGIIHRDLKPENLLLDCDGHIRVTDFGLAKLDPNDLKESRTLCGTDLYMAPEMIGGKGYGKAVDFWSLGIIIFEMLSGNTPFYARDTKRLYKMILSQKPKYPRWFSAVCTSLLKGLLNRNVEQRLGAAKSTMFQVKGVTELKSHAFFKGTDWEKVLEKEVTPPYKPDLKDGAMDTSNFCETFTSLAPGDLDEEAKRYDKHLERANSDDFAGFSYTRPSYIEMTMKQATIPVVDNIVDNKTEGEEEEGEGGEEEAEVVEPEQGKVKVPYFAVEEVAPDVPPVSANLDKKVAGENAVADDWEELAGDGQIHILNPAAKEWVPASFSSS